MSGEIRVLGDKTAISRAISASKHRNCGERSLAINPRPGAVPDVAWAILRSLGKRRGGEFGYRRSEIDDTALAWLGAMEYRNLAVLRADELDALQLAWIVEELAPLVERLILIGLDEREIRRRLPRGYEGHDQVAPLTLGRFESLMSSSRESHDARFEALRNVSMFGFRAACQAEFSSADFRRVERVLYGTALTIASHTPRTGNERPPKGRIVQPLALAESNFDALVRFRGLQIGLLHSAFCLYDRPDVLGDEQRRRFWDPLYKIGSPQAAATAALLLCEPWFARRLDRLEIAAGTPKWLARDGRRRDTYVPARARPFVNAQVRQLEAEGRGDVGAPLFPDRQWDLSWADTLAESFSIRLANHCGVEIRLSELAEEIRPDPELETDDERDCVYEEHNLILEIMGTQSDILASAMSPDKSRAAARLAETGVLELVDGRFGITEEAAFGLFLESGAELPCSGYRRRPINASSPELVPTHG